MADSGVVNQNVEGIEPRERIFDAGRGCHVHMEWDCVVNLFRERLCQFLVDVRDQHASAASGQGTNGLLANPAGASRDQRCSAVESKRSVR